MHAGCFVQASNVVAGVIEPWPIGYVKQNEAFLLSSCSPDSLILHRVHLHEVAAKSNFGDPLFTSAPKALWWAFEIHADLSTHLPDVLLLTLVQNDNLLGMQML